MTSEETTCLNKNPYFEEWGCKPYNAYPVWFRNRFGERYQKISIDAGFTCPNRDGTKGTGGCTYCNNKSFTPSYCKAHDDLFHQVSEGIGFFSRRYRRAKKFLAYLQSYSNTYKPLSDIEAIYESILSHPDIYGLVISTRPDCVDERLLDYLAKLSDDYLIFLEFGIESCYNATLMRINRCHTFEDSVKAINMATERNLHVAAHLLFGLPGETREMMLEQARIVSGLGIESLKFHQLQIIKGTRMAAEYVENPELFRLFSLEEYIQFSIAFLERLKPEISVQRFFSETPPRLKLAPDWGLMRSDVLNQRLEETMVGQNTWQGKLL